MFHCVIFGVANLYLTSNCPITFCIIIIGDCLFYCFIYNFVNCVVFNIDCLPYLFSDSKWFERKLSKMIWWSTQIEFIALNFRCETFVEGVVCANLFFLRFFLSVASMSNGFCMNRFSVASVGFKLWSLGCVCANDCRRRCYQCNTASICINERQHQADLSWCACGMYLCIE